MTVTPSHLTFVSSVQLSDGHVAQVSHSTDLNELMELTQVEDDVMLMMK